MNKVYKTIWCSVRNAWVVVSELSLSHSIKNVLLGGDYICEYCKRRNSNRNDET
ncbi:ESPR domain-containing protein [Escherichia albertii]|uniref:ESPR domain-containing protein n=1 Tax=Escherichia albertii TaxID=208962 RepID=UPI003B6345CB